MHNVTNKESVLSHKGHLDFEVIGNLITRLKEEVDQMDVKITIYKKILTIMIESLENIFKYNDHFENEKYLFPKYQPTFSLVYDANMFVITTTNPILNSHIENIKDKIDKVINIDRDTLKKYYRETITNGQFSNKGGAGLGFIEMAKIANQQIAYNFEKIDNKFSNYTLQITIYRNKE
ncbi:MAG: SiaB family protein kinase [Bacteroidales bacterium]|nr:SiaB family protein kinase [Bacteroidales bacterium]